MSEIWWIATNCLTLPSKTLRGIPADGFADARFISSVGSERLLDREEVTGSNPVWITKKQPVKAREQSLAFICHWIVAVWRKVMNVLLNVAIIQTIMRHCIYDEPGYRDRGRVVEHG